MKKQWEMNWDKFFRKYNPVNSPGSAFKYPFTIITSLRVYGRKVTDAEIASCPKLDITVNELLDLKFAHYNMVVRMRKHGVEHGDDHTILREFFHLQDDQEEKEFGRPNGEDHEDNINIAVVTQAPIAVITKAEAASIKSTRMPCARFGCRKENNYVGMCGRPGCSDRISFPKEEDLSDPNDTTYLGFVKKTHEEEVTDLDEEVIEMDPE